MRKLHKTKKDFQDTMEAFASCACSACLSCACSCSGLDTFSTRTLGTQSAQGSTYIYGHVIAVGRMPQN